MDSFGRLPTDVLNNIKSFYELPDIDIIEESKHDFYFCVKYLSVCTKIRMVGLISCWSHVYDVNDNDIFDKFINNLSNNVDCSYNEDKYVIYRDYDEYFNIDVKDNTIKVYNAMSEVLLSVSSKEQLINAMKKYCGMLNTYV